MSECDWEWVMGLLYPSQEHVHFYGTFWKDQNPQRPQEMELQVSTRWLARKIP